MDIPLDQPDIESERILLRKFRLEDAADMFEWASDDEVTQYLSWNSHRTLDDSRRYIEGVLTDYEKHEYGGWAIVLKSEQKVVGAISMRHWEREHRQTELGYVMNPKFHGRGIMTEAVALFIRFGFEQLHLNRIEARCILTNIGSEKVMQKVGMTQEGILRQHQYIKGAFHSFFVYSILSEEYDAARKERPAKAPLA